MKAVDPASIMGTFVTAILSLVLPASAMAADEVVRAHRGPAPDLMPQQGRATTDALRNDPILKSHWGPGDPDLVVPKFRFEIRGAPKR